MYVKVDELRAELLRFGHGEGSIPSHKQSRKNAGVLRIVVCMFVSTTQIAKLTPFKQSQFAVPTRYKHTLLRNGFFRDCLLDSVVVCLTFYKTNSSLPPRG